jgi:AmiR/NasT family two-component response regulator
VIHQATGFVIAQLGVPAEEAELLIRASAFAEGRSMREIAEELVARRRRFTVEGTVIEDGQ